jgi:small conductance mechanosensitive channel
MMVHHGRFGGALVMQPEITSQVDSLVRLYLFPIAWKLAGALAIGLGGRFAIQLIRAAMKRTMKVRGVDATLATYLETGATVGLQLLIVIAVLGVLGVETTSFAALLAAAGIAIGAAWSGLLSNFAAGLFLLTFRPFKVGDTIAAAGVVGVVREIGLFATAIDTPDNVRTYVGNNRLFSDNVQNYSANEYRRVDLTAQLPPGVNLEIALAALRTALVNIPSVLRSPAPVVEILTFSPAGPTVAVRPFCRNDDYWPVYFGVNRLIDQVVLREQSRQRAS